MTSAFDPDTFLNQTLDQANSTVIEPIPVGEYPAVIDDIKVRTFQTKRGESASLDVTWHLTDDELKSQLDRETLSVRQSIFLDITPQGTLDMAKGKNVQLGRLRDALNQNQPGQPWAVGMLKGAGPAKVKVGHRPDKNNPEIVYAEVTMVAKFS